MCVRGPVRGGHTRWVSQVVASEYEAGPAAAREKRHGPGACQKVDWSRYCRCVGGGGAPSVVPPFAKQGRGSRVGADIIVLLAPFAVRPAGYVN